MQIKDVIHLYLGCEVQTPQRKYRPEGGKSYKNIGRLMDIDLVISQGGVHFTENAITDLVHFPFDQLKPILRRLSSMTEEEAIELFKMEYNPHREEDSIEWISIEMQKDKPNKFDERFKVEPSWRINAKYRYKNGKESGMAGGLSLRDFNPTQFQWLLSNGFDLFGLLDAGLAIDKDKM